MRIDFPRAPRQHRKRKTPLDIAEELKLVSWQGRILVSCAVPRRVEFPRVPHVYPHADFCVGIFFFLNGCKEEIFKVFFFLLKLKVSYTCTINVKFNLTSKNV